MFFSAASIAGAFSGLLAFGIARMDGVGGLEGWRWIFILEGMVTVLVALWAFFALHDFPETATFLTEEERAFVVFRLKYQNQARGVEQAGQVRVAEAGEFRWEYVWSAFKDWQIWVNIFVYWGVSRYATLFCSAADTESVDCLSVVRHQPLPTNHHSKFRVYIQQIAATDHSNLYHRRHPRRYSRVAFGPCRKTQRVHGAAVVCHDFGLLHVGTEALLISHRN